MTKLSDETLKWLSGYEYPCHASEHESRAMASELLEWRHRCLHLWDGGVKLQERLAAAEKVVEAARKAFERRRRETPEHYWILARDLLDAEEALDAYDALKEPEQHVHSFAVNGAISDYCLNCGAKRDAVG